MRTLYRLACRLCQQHHIVYIRQNDDLSLDFYAESQPFSTSQIIGHLIRIILKRQSFITGHNRNFYGLIINKKQINEILSTLKDYPDTDINIEPKIIKYKRETVIEYFDIEGIRLSINGNLNLSVHLMPDRNILRFSTGEITNTLSKNNVSLFKAALNKMLTIEEGTYADM